MSQGNFGVAGLGVMGQNVALNIERNGFEVIAYNRSDANANDMRKKAEGKNVYVTQSIEEFVQKLEPPRRVLLMVTAGRGTDAVIDALLEHMAPGDIIIDGGNSHFPDTNRRAEDAARQGLSLRRLRHLRRRRRSAVGTVDHARWQLPGLRAHR